MQDRVDSREWRESWFCGEQGPQGPQEDPGGGGITRRTGRTAWGRALGNHSSPLNRGNFWFFVAIASLSLFFSVQCPWKCVHHLRYRGDGTHGRASGQSPWLRDHRQQDIHVHTGKGIFPPKVKINGAYLKDGDYNWCITSQAGVYPYKQTEVAVLSKFQLGFQVSFTLFFWWMGLLALILGWKLYKTSRLFQIPRQVTITEDSINRFQLPVELVGGILFHILEEVVCHFSLGYKWVAFKIG